MGYKVVGWATWWLTGPQNVWVGHSMLGLVTGRLCVSHMVVG